MPAYMNPKSCGLVTQSNRIPLQTVNPSAYISKRPLFRRSIDEALAGRYDVLVVHKLEKAGGEVVSITEQTDFSSPIGRVIMANLAAFGQYYSDNLSVEVSKGLKERAAQGLWVGPVPFLEQRSYRGGHLGQIWHSLLLAPRLFQGNKAVLFYSDKRKYTVVGDRS